MFSNALNVASVLVVLNLMGSSPSSSSSAFISLQTGFPNWKQHTRTHLNIPKHQCPVKCERRKSVFLHFSSLTCTMQLRLWGISWNSSMKCLRLVHTPEIQWQESSLDSVSLLLDLRGHARKHAQMQEPVRYTLPTWGHKCIWGIVHFSLSETLSLCLPLAICHWQQTLVIRCFSRIGSTYKSFVFVAKHVVYPVCYVLHCSNGIFFVISLKGKQFLLKVFFGIATRFHVFVWVIDLPFPFSAWSPMRCCACELCT